MSFSFDGNNKIIQIGDGITAIAVNDLYVGWKEWVISANNSVFQQAFRFVGGDPLPGSKKLGTTYFLMNGWKIRPYSGNHTLAVDGNLYTEDGSSPYVMAVGQFSVMIINSVSSLVDSTVQQLPEIEYASYNGGITIDTVLGTDSSDYPYGTPAKPCKTLYNVDEIAAVRGFTVYVEDGDLQKKVTTIRSKTGQANWCWYVDTIGNIWYYSTSIQKYNYIGLVNGLPAWDTTNAITYDRPSQFTEIRRLWYEPRTDEMYITGNSVSNPKPTGEFGGLGTTMIKYNNWTTTKDIQWTRILELDTVSTQGHTPAAWYHAGDYIFYVAGVREPRPIYVISKESGTIIGNIYPSSHVGGDRTYHSSYGYLGVIDLVYSLTAMKRSNGAYYIFLENDLTARNFLYIWCPTGNCPNN